MRKTQQPGAVVIGDVRDSREVDDQSPSDLLKVAGRQQSQPFFERVSHRLDARIVRHDTRVMSFGFNVEDFFWQDKVCSATHGDESTRF